MVENIGTKKVFTKIDLRWGYNNIRIKKEDKWKVAFTISEGSFKLTDVFQINKFTGNVPDYNE